MRNANASILVPLCVLACACAANASPEESSAQTSSAMDPRGGPPPTTGPTGWSPFPNDPTCAAAEQNIWRVSDESSDAAYDAWRQSGMSSCYDPKDQSCLQAANACNDACTIPYPPKGCRTTCQTNFQSCLDARGARQQQCMSLWEPSDPAAAQSLHEYYVEMLAADLFHTIDDNLENCYPAFTTPCRSTGAPPAICVSAGSALTTWCVTSTLMSTTSGGDRHLTLFMTGWAHPSSATYGQGAYSRCL